MKHITRGFAATAGILVLAAALAACSTPASTPSTPDTGKVVKANVVVATGPTLSNTNVYLGESQGIFTSHGLTATNATITAGPDAIPQLLSGAWTFAMVDTATAISAAHQGVPVIAVAPSTVGVPGNDGYAAIVAAPNSGIKTVKDLEGKKMQINALGGTAQALVDATMVAAGGDPSKINYVEIPPQGALPALQAGQVDAGFLPEPLLTAGLAAGMIDIGNPEKDTIPNLPSFVFLASKEFVAKNPAVVKQFQAAIVEANEKANTDHDLVIKTAATSTTVPAALLANVKRFPLYGTTALKKADVQKFIDFLVKYKVIKEADAPKASDVVLGG